jgi:long-chain acyl-CoA synthetase
MVVGDGRPFIGVLITLDAEALAAWLTRHGKPADTPFKEVGSDPDLLAELQAAVDDANKAVSRAESIRKFRLLDRDFTQEDGHLSAKLSLKRAVVASEFAADIEALYG